MDGTVLTLDGQVVTDTPDTAPRAPRTSAVAEDPMARYLLVGTDARGKPCYYIRLHVTGLRRRVFGPFRHKGHAIAAFDAVLQRVLEAFCDVENEDMGNAGTHGREMLEPPRGLKVSR